MYSVMSLVRRLADLIWLKMDWSEEKDGSDIKMQIFDVEKLVLYSVSFSFKSVDIVKKAPKKIAIFRYLRSLELP